MSFQRKLESRQRVAGFQIKLGMTFKRRYNLRQINMPKIEMPEWQPITEKLKKATEEKN